MQLVCRAIARQSEEMVKHLWEFLLKNILDTNPNAYYNNKVCSCLSDDRREMENNKMAETNFERKEVGRSLFFRKKEA